MSEWDLGGIAALGAFHGVNPAMGWLFAVALALQERSRRALLLALIPIAAGHEASIGIVVLLVQELRLLASDEVTRIVGAAALALFAVWRIVRAHRHPRWVGMRLRARELALWSFLMSTAHGAGLMLFPFLLGLDVGSDHDTPVVTGLGVAVLATGLHVLAMVVVAATVGLAVYEFAGLAVLRRGWLNVDRIWSYALGFGAAATMLTA